MLPRAITVPSSLIQKSKAKPPPSDPETAFANIAPNVSKSDATSESQHAPLIQEIESTPARPPTTAVPKSTKVSKSADTSLPGLRGILKKPVAPPKGAAELETSPEANADPLVPLEWDWSKDDKGRLRIVIKVSGLVSHFSLVYSISLSLALHLSLAPGCPGNEGNSAALYGVSVDRTFYLICVPDGAGACLWFLAGCYLAFNS